MEAALPYKDKEAAVRDTAIMVVAKGMAITMVVISDSIVAHPIAIGTTY